MTSFVLQYKSCITFASCNCLFAFLPTNMFKYLLIFLFALPTVQAFSQQKVRSSDLKKLYKWMCGSYSSQAQSEKDSSFFDIRLHMAPMWKDRKGEYWLYVEQATVSALDKPYRQRVYRLILLNDTTLESRVYTMKAPLHYAGEWKKSNTCSDLTEDSLEWRQGCSIYLVKRDKKSYKGSTNSTDCPSNLRGATYATSEVTITSNMLLSWDRGFDKEGKQVWGAVKGGYQFIKQK